MLDFADRFHFDAASRIALRADIRHLAALAVAHRRARCTAPAPASCSITRQLRAPWTGGHVALARAAGVERIEPGCDPRLSASCFAPVVADAGALDLTTLERAPFELGPAPEPAAEPAVDMAGTASKRRSSR